MATPLWAARLLPASFRGIPFFLDGHNLEGGRNAIQHEVPGGDKTFSEDIGRKNKAFKINGHVLGDNYFFIRDALEAAFDNKSKGVLIHPYKGPLEVRPGQYTITESNKEGRIARFSITFFEAGDESFPFAAINKATAVVTNIVAAVAAVQNAFQVAFSVAQLPGFAVESAQALVTDFTTTIRNGIQNVRLKPGEQSALLTTLDSVEGNVNSLVQNPASLAAEMDSIINQVRTVVADPSVNNAIDTASGRDDQLAVFDPIVEFDANISDIPLITTTRETEAANALAYQTLVRQLGTIRLSQAALIKDFTSNDQALDIRLRISDLIETQLNQVTDDDEFNAFENLNASITEALPNTGSNIGSIDKITLTAVKSSLELTYDRYESLTNEQDILTRNNIRRPGFIVGDIEVLSA